jgi:outer membrane receptor protein involved in Fe transport
MQRVEVLRGPQSILFGKNSIAGAISLTTAPPTDEFEGSASILYEPQDEEKVFSLVLSGPMGDNAAGRLSVRSRKIDGYLDNIFLNRPEPNRDELTVRGQLRWDPTDTTSITFKYERNQFDVLGRQVEIIDDVYDCAGLGPTALCNFLPTPPVPYSTLLVAGFGQDPSALNVTRDGLRTSNKDFSNNESDNFTLTINHDFANDVRFTAVTGVLSYDFQEFCDCDFSSTVVLDAPLFETYDQVSQELRFTSPGGQTIDWIAGAFFQSNEQSSPDVTGFPANSVLGPIVDTLVGPGAGALFADTGAERAFTQDTDAYNVFGQITWNATDAFRLSLGLRYTDEKKKAARSVVLTEFGGPPIDPVTDALRFQTAAAVYANLLNVQVIGHDISGSRDDKSTDYSVIAQWDVNEDWMLYGSVASGFKAGGFDTRSNVMPDPSGGVFPALRPGAFEFQDETATSYELGAKARLAGGAADVNVALFFTQYDDLQISIFDGGVGFNVGNAAGADIMGLEVDGRWQATENLGFYGSVAWLDFEFTNFLNGQCYFGENPGAVLCSRDGQTNQYVADYSGAVGMDYYMPVSDSLEFRATLDVMFSDDFFTAQNNDPVTVQDAFAKVNLRLALSGDDGKWTFALLGRNLTDEITVPYSNPVPLASTFGSNSHYAFVERGRTVALQAEYRF